MNKNTFNTLICLFTILIILSLIYNYYVLQYKVLEPFYSENNPENNTRDFLDFAFPNYNTIHNEKSKYQQISIIKNDFAKCLLLNDEIQLCTDNERKYHELITHFPAAYLSSLKYVLIIGGGDLMTLREVMKYNIKGVDMLELDEKVINASLKHFTSSNISKYENDKRVNIHIGDASTLIHKLYNKKYDLIIIDTTEDSDTNTPVETKGFFKKCKELLNSNGILVKNGFFSKDMEFIVKQKKNYIFNYLLDLFKNVGIYKIDTPDYQDDEEYKFILCSDHYKISDSLLNNETKKLSLYQYNNKNHHKYIDSKNISLNNI